MALIDGLEICLAEMAKQGETITYGELARDLGIVGPGTIARLTKALEATMADDWAAGRPFRAALCVGRLSGGLPAPGFFHTARALGRYLGSPDGPEAEAFVRAERSALSES